MKKADFKNSLKSMTKEQLIKVLSEKKLELSKLALMVKASKASNYADIKKIRTEIAQILTAINQL